MASRTSYCPSCGSPLQPQAGFCTNCGAKITPPTMPTSQWPQGYHPPTPQPPVSTGPYKVIIATLLIVIIFLGIFLFIGHVPFSLGNYRYQLANPPNAQSILPLHSHTTQNYLDPMWNACKGPQSAGCSMTSNGWREGSVPDTFDYYVSFTSTVNVTVYFFTMGQFVQFSVCNGDLSCVSGSYDSIPATTNLPKYTLFTLGEGCADYLAIYVASGSGVMYPDVGVTHSPSPSQIGATGYCAQAGP